MDPLSLSLERSELEEMSSIVTASLICVKTTALDVYSMFHAEVTSSDVLSLTSSS